MHLIGIAGFGMLHSCMVKYGTPQPDYGIIVDNYINFHGKAYSQDSLKPIPGLSVKLTVNNSDTLYATTSQTGSYSSYYVVEAGQYVKLIYTDTDGTLHGNFYGKDTNLTVTWEDFSNMYCETDVFLQRKP